jgi:murein DD-endopeptidase MepM/ murein hydrolase activator NlpD
MDCRIKLALVIAFGALMPMLAACTPDTPETQFRWGVNDRVANDDYRPAPPPPAYREARAHEARTYVYRDGNETEASVKPKPRPRYDAPVRQTASYEREDRGSGAFAWPASGKVISSFGTTTNGERNDGINIATPMGTPIHAAAGGTVSYSGNELKDYGNLLLIKHPGGYVTAYAHADQLLVRSGDTVTKGQVIGYAGRTGDVSTPQLHFEIRHGTQPVNPDSYLAPRGGLG